MKTVTATKRWTKWLAPALAVSFAGANLSCALAAPAKETKPKTAKAPRLRSKTLEGTFAQASATSVKVQGKSEAMTAALVPTTAYWRTQKGVAAGDLKVGDTIKMNVPGTDDMGRVESLFPLTLKFGENATVIFNTTGRMKFERVSKITPTDLVTGQKGKIASNIYPDSRIEAREVWVYVEPEKKATSKNQ